MSVLALVLALILLRIMTQEKSTGAARRSLDEILSANQPVLRDRLSLILILAACSENIGVNTMWTYYGAFYVERHGFNVKEVGWVSLAAGFLASFSARRRLDADTKRLRWYAFLMQSRERHTYAVRSGTRGQFRSAKSFCSRGRVRVKA